MRPGSIPASRRITGSVPRTGSGTRGRASRTNSVTSGTAVDPNPQPGDGGDGTAVPDSTADPRYRRGAVDTLRLTLTGLEQRLRFQAARDSVLYFGKVLPLGGRVFDSGWLLLNQVRRNPSNYDEAFHVFDYSRGDTIPLDFVNGHVYHRRIIRQYLGSTTPSFLTARFPTVSRRRISGTCAWTRRSRIRTRPRPRPAIPGGT